MTAVSRLDEARLRIDSLPPDGRQLSVELDETARADLAGEFGLSAVNQLSAQINIRPIGGGFRLTGTLLAMIVQPCVVTFEPVVQQIEEALDRVFLPGRPAAAEHSGHIELFVDPEADEPDYFEGHEIDVAPMLREHLALAIDPYPRSPGAAITESADHPADEDRPFAALARLKAKPGEGG